MDADVTDERALMGRVSGVLWLTAGAVGAVGQALPGSPHAHPALIWSLFALVALYALACVTGAIPWGRIRYGGHLAAVLLAQPVIGLSLWVTGGAASYITPVLALAMLYAAYFLPGAMAWVGVGALALTNASTLLYADASSATPAAARALAFAVACVGLTRTIQLLKGRLLEAELRQRTMAHQDPLTGLANRREFDDALRRALAVAGEPRRGRRAGDADARFALLLVDIDDFKQINDGFGHTSGDRVLRDVAARAEAVVRPTDCLARIGGDELAIVAPGAGEDGARRLADALREAAAHVRPGPDAPPVSLTVSWAVFPADGTDEGALFAAADRGLHDGKRARRPVAGPTSS